MTTHPTQEASRTDQAASPTLARRLLGQPWTELSRSDKSARAAWIAFAGYLLVAFVLLVGYWGEDYWFRGDDWGMIIGRDLFDVGDWFRPQNGHWSLLPTISYQALYKVVGLRSYGPYQNTVIVLHLTLAVLLRIIMRRAGVGPWVATIAAGTFVLFGAGAQNILEAIQVSMVGSLVFGLIHVLLADHDGPPDYRDGLGLVSGAVALSASGVGLLMLAVVGGSTLLRRGWRAAALHTVPLLMFLGLWYVLAAPDDKAATTLDPGAAVSWAWTGWSGAFMALGNYRPVAVALVCLLAVGLALVTRDVGWASFRRLLAVPIVMLVASVASFVLISTQRAWVFDASYSRTSRYIAIAVVFILPAMAVAADAVIRRWRWTAPLVLLLLVVGVPANLDALEGHSSVARGQHLRTAMLATAYSPLIPQVADDIHPDPHQLRGYTVTTGFLKDALAAGKLPPRPDLRDGEIASAETRLKLSQSPVSVSMPDELVCEAATEPRIITGRFGDEFGIYGAVRVKPTAETNGSAAVDYKSAWAGPVLTVQVPEFTFEVSAVGGAPQYVFCEP